MDKPFLVKSVQDFIDKLSAAGGKPLYEMSYEEAREFLQSLQSECNIFAGNDVFDVAVDVDGGYKMPLKIVRPKHVSEKMPVIFYIHGGGWVMGNYATHERLVNELAERTQAAVVFPVYMQSPESQFPQTTDNLFAALRHVVFHADEYNFDKENLIVAGDSVGGNMALVMALLAKQQTSEPRIKFMLLLYPVTGADLTTESYREFAEGPWLTQKAMQWFWDAYAPSGGQRDSIFSSPLRASLEELEGLPPALIITAENDVLRDEGEAMARKLDAAGVETASVRINGTIHDFLMLNALQSTAPSKEGMSVAVEAVKRAVSHRR